MSHCRNASTFQKIYQVLFGNNMPLPDYEGGNCPPTKHLPLNEPVEEPDIDTTGFGFGPGGPTPVPHTTNPSSHTDSHSSDVGGHTLEPTHQIDTEPVDPDTHQAVQHGHEEIANQIDWMLHEDQQYEDIANDLYQQSTYIPEGVLDQLQEGDEIDTPETYDEYLEEHPTTAHNPYDTPDTNVGVPRPLEPIDPLPEPTNPPVDNVPPVNQDTDTPTGTVTNPDTGISTTHTGSIYVYGFDGSSICRCPTWKTYGQHTNMQSY